MNEKMIAVGLSADEAVWLLGLLGNLTYSGDEKTVLWAIQSKRSVVEKIQVAVEGIKDEKVPSSD